MSSSPTTSPVSGSTISRTGRSMPSTARAGSATESAAVSTWAHSVFTAFCSGITFLISDTGAETSRVRFGISTNGTTPRGFRK